MLIVELEQDTFPFREKVLEQYFLVADLLDDPSEV